MTREEAKQILKEHKIMFQHDFGWNISVLEALDMAISALSENKGDLISRQAVLDMATTIQTDDCSGNEIIEVVDVDDVKALPSVENKGEWIPVSERLPEKNVWVLVTVEQNEMRYQEIMRRNNYKEGWTDNIDIYTDEITAWQPLPEPYKAESEGKPNDRDKH